MPSLWWNKTWQQLRAIAKPKQLDRNLNDEVAFHLAMREEKNRATGMSDDEARHAAHRQFGNTTLLKEQTRAMWISTSLEALWRDFAYALRTMRKKPGFALVAVITLGLGIGASTAIFSVIENVLVEPFPYPDADRFMTLEIRDANKSDTSGRAEYPGPEFLDYTEKNHVFDRVIADASEEVLYDLGDGVERFHGVLVTPGTFEFFGMHAMLGRVMQPADYEPGAPPVFVLRYKTWIASFAGDPSVLNKVFVLNGVSRTLIGIMPPRFGWGNGDVFIPVKPTRATAPVFAGEFPPVWYLMGHLKPRVSIPQAEADLTVVANQLSGVYPQNYPPHFIVRVVSATDMVVGHFRRTLYLTLGAVALLLLISCANVANLLLARGTTREREMAIRSALGASRWRLIRQQMVESLLLAVLAAALGIALAAVGLNSLVSLIPQETIPAETLIHLNLPVLLFAIAIAMFTPVIFGLIPALQGARKDLEKPLRESGKGTSGSGRQGRLRDALIVCEVALSFMLLVGAGLLIRSFVALREVDLGFHPDHVLITRLPLPSDRYKTAEQLTAFYRPLLARMKALPGVVDVAESSAIPPYGGFGGEIEIAGKVRTESWKALFQLCSEGYFEVLHVPLIEGRTFNESEVYDARKLAVVNKTFVRKYLGNENPIGQRVRLSDMEKFPDKVSDPWFEIVGVVGDIRNRGLQEPAQPEVWVPYTVTGSGQRGLLIRTSNDPMAIFDSVRREVWATDRSVALTFSGTLENYINSQSYAGPRFGFVLMSVFAAVGLVLVSIGVYSVVAYATARRTHEIGIRMALGASPGDALKLILGSGMRVIGLGVFIGFVVSLALSRMLATQMWQVSVHDPATIAGVTILLLATGAVASFLPAQRATTIAPTTALRHE